MAFIIKRREAIIPTAGPRLHIAPSTMDLSGLELELGTTRDRAFRLRDAIADLNHVLATTARERGQMKRVFTPAEAMPTLAKASLARSWRSPSQRCRRGNRALGRQANDVLTVRNQPRHRYSVPRGPQPDHPARHDPAGAEASFGAA